MNLKPYYNKSKSKDRMPSILDIIPVVIWVRHIMSFLDNSVEAWARYARAGLGRYLKPEELVEYRQSVPPDDIRDLTVFSGLTTLCMENTEVGAKESIRYISMFHSLRSLHLGDSEIDDNDLHELSKNRNITEIIMGHGNKVTNIGVEAISSSGNLETANFLGCTVTPSGLMALAAQSPKLQHLYMGGTAFTGVSIPHLNRDCPELRTLRIMRCDDIRNCEIGLMSLHKLTGLELFDCYDLNDGGVANIVSNCQAVSQLKLINCGGVTGASIHELTRLLDLTDLDISGCNSIHDGFEYQPEEYFRQLQNLTMANTDTLTEDMISVIVDMSPYLHHLDVSGSPLNGTGLAGLVVHKYICELYVAYCGVDIGLIVQLLQDNLSERGGSGDVRVNFDPDHHEHLMFSTDELFVHT